MKFSYNWLRELVPGLETDPAALMRLVTQKTAECEGLEEVGALLACADVARILEVEGRRAVVDAGRYGQRTVICGAPNLRPGMLTAYTDIGTKVVHGVESNGMLASGSELGINNDHEGIVELVEGQALPVVDHVIEVDNKSLTHRPDLWGHFGMAREVAAIGGGTLRDPVDLTLLPDGAAQVAVDVEDFALCPRYSALVFENATVQPSPLWLQYRLQSIGLNSINNIVDVTNLVMAELAQPMHAFDADRLASLRIFVRPARPGERITALNHSTYELTPANLVIADEAGPVAIAGVIGGLDSAIDGSTTRLVFESANFQASSVRRTSTQLKLRTDASMRFEKSQDPVNTLRGLARAVELLREVSPGIRLVGGLTDVKAELKTAPPVDLPIDWLSRKLGRRVTEPEVRGILESLQFGVSEPVAGTLRVSIPSWRATKDIAHKDDLLEEVGRMIGFESIQPVAPLVGATPPPANPERLFQRRVRLMAAAQGFTESYNYSFLSEEAVHAFGLTPEEHIRVANPIASDQSLMRKTLLPGLLRNILDNTKHLDVFRLFEIGREIHAKPCGLPDEIPHFAAVSYSRDGDGSAGLFDVKRLAECLMPGVRIAATSSRPFEHPERSGALTWHDEPVGRIFELHPSLVSAGRASILDIDLRVMQSRQPGAVKYQPLRKFPTSAFDLSVVVDLREPVGGIQSHIEESGGNALVGIEFVRQYVGSPLPEGRKSVSFRMTLGASDRTLSSEEVAVVRNRIIERLRELGFDLRV